MIRSDHHWPGLHSGPIVVKVWTDVVGGLKTLCIKISYSESTRAQSREGSSTLAESSRWRNARFWLAGDSGARFWLAAEDPDWLPMVFDSAWLPRRVVSVQCIRIWSRLIVLKYPMHVLRYGAESRVNVLRHVMHVLR